MLGDVISGGVDGVLVKKNMAMKINNVIVNVIYRFNHKIGDI